MTLDRANDLMAVVVHIENVAPAIPPELAGADVDHRNAEVRTLANADARIANQAARVVQQSQEVFRRHVLEEMEVCWLLVLPERSHTPGSPVRAGIHVGPEPQGRH